MIWSGLMVCATVDRPSLDPAEDVDPDVGGHRYERHSQPGRDEEEIDGRVGNPETAIHGKSFETLLSELFKHCLALVTLQGGHADKEDSGLLRRQTWL